MILDASRTRRRRPRAGVCLTIAVIVALGSGSAGQQPGTPQTGAPRQRWPQRPGVFRPIVVEAPPAARVTVEPQAQPDAPAFVPNEVLVQFEPEATDADRAAARTAARAALAATLRPDRRLERLTTSLSVGEAAAILQALPQVEFAEPNWIYYREATANDPYFLDGSLWGTYGDASTPANPFGSQAAELWAQGFTGADDVYVAVIDEGIDVGHPDLAPNIWTNPFDPIDGSDNDGNGYVDDVHGWDFLNNDSSVYDGSPSQPDVDSHGTHVAGTIGARGGNGIGVAGVSWNVKIISGKFLDVDGSGDSFHAAAVLDYLVDLKTRHGLNIVAANSSWGGEFASQTLYEAIVRAAAAGILIVAAAGNEGRDNDTVPHYPSHYSTLSAAGYEAVIAVASITREGQRSEFSNYGQSSVDIGAPGSEILSTLPGSDYAYFDGTSMATPHVTGAVALYKAIHPNASPSQIRSAILSQGAPTESLAGITSTGRRLDVSAFNRFNLSVDGPSIAEGNSGTTNAIFTVSLSEPKATTVSVDYATADVTAFSGTVTGSAISIQSVGRAAPYPSSVVVPVGTGVVTKIQVVLSGLTHMFTDEVDVLLVGPGGQKCVLMADVSGNASNVTLTFDDAGTPLQDASTSGTYRPTNNGAVFSSPAPGGPYGSSLSVFNGTPAAGTWSLFVMDDAAGDGGSIDSWSLLLTTSTPDYIRTTGTLTFLPNATTQTVSVPVVGDTAFEPAETFKLVLGDAVGANIVDAEAIATIRNDDFTDLSLTGLLIKAIHIAELRAAIDEARAAKGLPAYSFTDPLLTAQSTVVRAIHIVELRAALAEAYAVSGASPPAYTDQTITPGVTTIKAAHITEVRAALLGLP
jgi:subtilisin family serine protease